MWLSLGGFHERTADGESIHNTHLIVNSSGEIEKIYRKVNPLSSFPSLSSLLSYPFRSLFLFLLICNQIHLFDINIPNGPVMQESKVITAGDRMAMCKSPFGNIGMSVCYDLRYSIYSSTYFLFEKCIYYNRFPELYASLRHKGAHVILVPAAFAVKTGIAHWKTLLVVC